MEARGLEWGFSSYLQYKIDCLRYLWVGTSIIFVNPISIFASNLSLVLSKIG